MTDWTPEAIRALRERLGMNQTQMAPHLGYRRGGRVSELELGAMNPSDQVCRLLDHLDVHGPLPADRLPK